MELEEMKSVWTHLSDQLEEQKRLTQDLILKMTREKSRSRLNRIVRMEAFGVTFSALFLIFIASQFYRLSDWLAITGAIGTSLILALAIVIGIRIIQKANRIDIAKNSYHQTWNDFKSLTKLLGNYKRLSIWINVAAPFFMFPTAFALLGEGSALDQLREFGIGLIAAAIFTPLILFGIIKYYSRNVSQVREALEDVNKSQSN